jgi:hypothetical protein
MPFTGRLRHRLLPLLRSERGMALPTALFAMIASFALASAAVLSSVDAQQGSSRDRESKNAIAAADAGANLALLRLNRFKSSLKLASPCVGPNGEEQQETSPGSGWCPATSAENVGGSTFYYQVSAYRGEKVEQGGEVEGEEGELKVVAVGTAGGVSRRVEVGLAAYDGENVFANAKLIGESDVLLKGDATIDASIATNGSIETSGKGESAEICGDVRVGVGESTPEEHCTTETGFEVTEGEKRLPAIVPPENLATLNAENGTCRLEAPVPGGVCKGVDIHTGSNPWKPGTGMPGKINIGANTALTMSGEDYLVCGLSVAANGKLYIGAAPGQPLRTGHVRIFVDTPEHCGIPPASGTQVEINGNTTSTGYIPAEDPPMYEVPVIYVLGSPTIPTKVKLCGNSGENELILYAPYSEIEICGNATWEGMIAGQSLTLDGNPVIISDPHMPPPKLAAQSLWERTRYVECTGLAATLPDASC